MSTHKTPKEQQTSQGIGPGFFYWQKGKIVGPVNSLAGGLRNGCDGHTPKTSLPESKRGQYLSEEISEKINLLNESTAKALHDFNLSFQDNVRRLTKIDPQFTSASSVVVRDFPKFEETVNKATTLISPSPDSNFADLVIEHEALKDQAISSAMPIRPERNLVFEPSYLTLKGQLRLGNLKSPFAKAFIDFFLSLGISSYFWVKSIMSEIYWHRDQKCSPPSRTTLLSLLALIPGFGIITYFLVAAHVASMERQNGYQNILPWLGAFLGIFPPFAIFYIQDCVNHHWLLHIEHMKQEKEKQRRKEEI